MARGKKLKGYPGIYKATIGYVVRATQWNPKKGKPDEIEWTVAQKPDGTPADLSFAGSELARAKEELARQIAEDAPAAKKERKRLGEYGTDLINEKIRLKQINGAKSEQKTWAQFAVVKRRFGAYYVDAITRKDAKDFRGELADLMYCEPGPVPRGMYRPSTVRGWWRMFRTIQKAYAIDHGITDLGADILGIQEDLYETYTPEEPNSLTAEELARFILAARDERHFAPLLVGIMTGRRPCELRPLRRRGPIVDIDWNTGELRIRRSQVLGAPGRTKTKHNQRITLPPVMLRILRKHVDDLEGAALESDLLFPSRDGAYLGDKAYEGTLRRVAAAAGITKKITPRFMRRTYQDLARNSGLHDKVIKSMSGHMTDEMVAKYSTIWAREQANGLAKMLAAVGVTDDQGDGGDGEGGAQQAA